MLQNSPTGRFAPWGRPVAILQAFTEKVFDDAEVLPELL